MSLKLFTGPVSPSFEMQPLLTSSQVQIRWMIRRDLSEVLTIENRSFEFAWSEKDFLQCLRHRNCIGMVAEQDGRIAGYMVYELDQMQIRLLSLAVASEYRREGIATQMIHKLVNKLSVQRRSWISLTVRETNLAAQLFFRTSGFRAVSVLRDYYEDTTEDAYLMQYLYDDLTEAASIAA